MSNAWRRLDLRGGGLQSANVMLAARLKRRGRAYRLLALAPLGLHRAYLDSRRGCWLWRAAGACVIAAFLLDQTLGYVALGALLVAMVRDGFWIDRRVTALNKAIRREVYLGHGAVPPPGFRGREAAHDATRVASFAEQERLLAEIARRRKGGADGENGHGGMV